MTKNNKGLVFAQTIILGASPRGHLLFISKIEAREPRPYGETEMQVIAGRY